MKVGDYVRTKRGEIHKITDLSGYYENGRLIKEKQLVHIDNKISGWNYEQFNEIIIKSSPNIIDLIEVGDYVNGYKATYVVNEEPCPSGKFVDIDCDKDSSDSYFFENDIKTIVTKEQFSQMEYRIGE